MEDTRACLPTDPPSQCEPFLDHAKFKQHFETKCRNKKFCDLPSFENFITTPANMNKDQSRHYQRCMKPSSKYYVQYQCKMSSTELAEKKMHGRECVDAQIWCSFLVLAFYFFVKY